MHIYLYMRAHTHMCTLFTFDNTSNKNNTKNNTYLSKLINHDTSLSPESIRHFLPFSHAPLRSETSSVRMTARPEMYALLKAFKR